MGKQQVVRIDPAVKNRMHGADFFPLHTQANSPLDGCVSSVGHYGATEYPDPGVHEDHEGFYVMEGTGAVLLGGVEYRLEPGTAFYAPAGTPHAIRKDVDSQDLKIFLYHFPVSNRKGGEA